jgi:hypothetical protein
MSMTNVLGLIGVVCCYVLSTAPAVLATSSTQPQNGDAKQQLAAGDNLQPLGCNSPVVIRGVDNNAGGTSIVQEVDYGLQRKSWSPLGDTIKFTIKSFSGIPEDASVLVCFRWESRSGSNGYFIETRPSQLDLSSDRKQLNITATVPDDLGKKPQDVKTLALLVPFAEVRILAISRANKLVANVPTEIGITYPVVGLLFVIIAIIMGFAALYFVKGPQSEGIEKATWFLRVISTKDGFASLSQLQLLLWTFVVGVSAVYVMSLSGRLVEITSGTLILLGIAGATGIGAAIQNGAQAAKARAAPANGAQNAQAQSASPQPPSASQTVKPPSEQTPKWSDLLINQTVTEAGVVPTEIDVTRFQMLLFTLITAVFVLITVATTYVIPEIPSGFVTLMGISNGVYLGSKVIQS